MCYVSMNAIREARPLHREVLSAVLMYFAIAELSEVSEHCYSNKPVVKRTTTIHLILFLEYYPDGDRLYMATGDKCGIGCGSSGVEIL